MTLDYLISNVKIVDANSNFRGSIGIKKDKIKLICAKESSNLNIAFKEIYNGEGLTLIPGCIDPHVHLREPDAVAREDFFTGTRSAAAGGITTIIDHPVDPPPVLNKQALKNKLESVKNKSFIDFGFWGGITNSNLENLHELAEEGVFAFKAFLCSSDPEYPMINDGVLLQAMEKTKSLNTILGLHAENEDIIKYLEKKKNNHEKSRPEIAELEAINRSIFFSRMTGSSVHILHLSSAKGANFIKKAKRMDVPITTETCPHYLVLDKTQVKENNYALCNPPLRKPENKNKLWDFLKKGFIDIIVSDHSPYTFSEKKKQFPGITGLQTSLPLMLNYGLNDNKINMNDIVRLMSTKPAKLFGLYPKKGSLLPGTDADFVLVDEEAEWDLTNDELYYKNKWSPYDGIRLKGKVIETWIRGKPVYHFKKEFLVKAGYGEFLRKDN